MVGILVEDNPSTPVQPGPDPCLPFDTPSRIMGHKADTEIEYRIRKDQ